MAVKIRLSRRGRKKLALYNLVVADARTPRDGKFIENLGIYNPNTNPATVDIDENKTLEWIMKGAQPTDTARRILSYKGIMLKKHLQLGVLKGAITQEDADKKFDDWKAGKDSRIQGKVDSLSKEKALGDQKKLDAEKKKNEARAAEQLAKEAAAVAEIAEEEAEVTETPEAEESVEAPVAEVAPVEEPVAEVAAPVEEVVEEPVAEVAAPVEEVVEESVAEVAETVEEVKEEAPKAEVKAEAPEAEAKEDTSEEEKK